MLFRSDRPARVQIEQKRKLQEVEHQGDFNIWYGKYMGENNFQKAARASTRVCRTSSRGAAAKTEAKSALDKFSTAVYSLGKAKREGRHGL